MKTKPAHPPQDDRQKKKRVFRRTIALMLIFGVGTFVWLAWQLFQVQIVQGEEFQEKAARQQTRDLTVSADRGTIYDREGNILAISATVQNVGISPKDIAEKKLDKALIASGLARLTGTEEGTILKRMERTYSEYEIIARKLEKEDSEAVREFIAENKLGAGVFLEPDSKRYYPYSSLASHVVGFVGAENKGLYGVEMIYDDVLSGTAGRVVTARTGNGTEMLSPYENYIDAQDGRDVHLTLDATIQGYAEKALSEGIEKFDVQRGGFCIVMDPNTGGILAMADAGGYDLNSPFAIADPDKAEELEALKATASDEVYRSALGEAQNAQWRNRCVSDSYEPGSTFKSIVVSAALEEGVVDLNSQFFCNGVKRVAIWDIHCANRSGHGQQDLQLAVQNSCNPAFIEIGQALGASRMYDYFQDFGLLNTTGIDLNGEGISQIWPRSQFTGETGLASLATASFGQTMKVTPIQLITAASAVVNGGNLVQPHVLDYTTDGQGNVVDRFETNVIRQVVSADTSQKVCSILEQVVGAPKGTGKNAYQAGYRIGGKTGTSENTENPEAEDEYLVSFLGVAPANDPKVVILLAYDFPKPVVPGSSYTAGGTYISGGNMAAPMAGPLLGQILEYMGVEKQYSAEELSGADTTVPQVVGYTAEQAVSALEQRGFTYRVVGEGEKVTGQIPASGAVIPGGSQVVIYLGEPVPTEPVEVPDLSGLTPDAARKALASVQLIMKGTGSSKFFTSATLAGAQGIAPGTPVNPGTVVEVTFVENVNDFTANDVG